MWSAYLFAPLALDPSDYQRLVKIGWKAWGARLPPDERGTISEDAGFFIPSVRRWYLPSESRAERCHRWTAPLDLYHQVPRLFDENGVALAYVAWVDLFRFPGQAFLVIHLRTTRSLDDQQVRYLSRCASEWLPQYADHRLTSWKVGGETTEGLRPWIMKHLVGLDDLEDWSRVESQVHWFGSAAASLFMLHRPQVPDWSGDEPLQTLIEHICLGIEDEDEQYGPSKEVRARIGAQYVQEWENWRLHEWRGRMVLIYGGESRGGQPRNTDRYYVPMMASVLYQRVMIASYLDRFIDGGEDDGALREAFNQFRRDFLAHRICSYPLGNEIYDFLRRVNGIPEAHRDVEDELHAADQLARLEVERQEMGLIRNLTVLAAVFVPVSAISSVFGADTDQLYAWPSWFWGLSMGATAVVGGALAAAWLRRKWTGV